MRGAWSADDTDTEVEPAVDYDAGRLAHLTGLRTWGAGQGHPGDHDVVAGPRLDTLNESADALTVRVVEGGVASGEVDDAAVSGVAASDGQLDDHTARPLPDLVEVDPEPGGVTGPQPEAPHLVLHARPFSVPANADSVDGGVPVGPAQCGVRGHRVDGHVLDAVGLQRGQGGVEVQHGRERQILSVGVDVGPADLERGAVLSGAAHPPTGV